jgi:hypothetical protein
MWFDSSDKTLGSLPFGYKIYLGAEEEIETA